MAVRRSLGIAMVALALLATPALGAEGVYPPTGVVAPAVGENPLPPRLPVTTGPVAPAARTADQRLADEDVFRLATEVRDTLRDLRAAVVDRGTPEMLAQTDAAIRQIGDLQISAMGGADLPTLRGQFEAFRPTWQLLDTRIRALPQLTDWAVARIARIETDSEMLARLLAVASKPAYDAARVSQLARDLVEATARLAESLRRELTPTQGIAALQRYAGMLHRSAENLAALVRDGAGVVAVGDEFRNFDQTWRLFLRWSEPPTVLAPPIAAQMPGLWELDRQLYRELAVESPAYSPDEQFRHQAAALADLAERIPDALHREQIEGSRTDILAAARTFAGEARSFAVWAQQQRTLPGIGDPRVQALRNSWQHYDNFMKTAPSAATSVSHRLVEELAVDADSLFARLRRP